MVREALAMLITTLKAVSNRSTWRDQVEIKDEDDALVDLETDVDDITLSLRDQESGTVIKEVSLSGGGISIGGSLGAGVLEFVISADDMKGIAPKTYEVGLLIEFAPAVGGDTEQVILGRVPVLRGL